MSVIANISIFTCVSVQMSMCCYQLMYTIINIISVNNYLESGQEIDNTSNLFVGLAIGANTIYSLTSVILLTYYKDILFSLVFIIIQVGYVSKSSQLTSSEIITSIVLLGFVFIGIVTSSFKNGKKAFGYEADDDVDILIEHKKKGKGGVKKLSVDL